jgi:hypothetical protein
VTLSYLSKYASVVLNASGNGNAVLGPDTGQYWLPTLAHIGTASTLLPTAGCALHIGTPQVLDYTTQIDYSFAGVSDTTGLVSSHVVFPGQVITAQFLGGNPGDTAILVITGVSSDVPPTIGIEPAFPGTHFSGAEGLVAIAGQPIAVTVTGTPTVDIGGQPINVTATISGTPTVDIGGQPVSVTATISGTPTVDIGGQPIEVTEQSKQMFANQTPIYINENLAAAASFTVIAATAGTTLYLHDMSITGVNNGTMTSCKVQDTNSTLIDIFFQQVAGTPANAAIPNTPVHTYHGAPLAAGAGLEIVNGAGSSQQFVGYLTYSK